MTAQQLINKLMKLSDADKKKRVVVPTEDGGYDDIHYGNIKKTKMHVNHDMYDKCNCKDKKRAVGCHDVDEFYHDHDEAIVIE